MARRSVPKSWLAYVLMGLSAGMMAQQASPPGAAPPQSIPKFISRTELVTVPVIVSRHGEHVAGLTKDDFAVEEDGGPKSPASFEESRSLKSTLKPVTPAPGIYTNEVVADGLVTMVVILLDLINTPYVYQENTKKKLLEYLQTDYRGDRPTMLVALHPSGLRVLHDFTTDPRVLVSLVHRLRNNVEHDPRLDEQVKTETSGTLNEEIDVKKEYDEMEREFVADFRGSETFQEQLQGGRVATTLYQLQQLAHALSAVRGMKSLVWATGGITLPYSMSSRATRIVQEYVQTMKLLSAAGVAVYPIDTFLETDNPAYSGPQSRYPRPLSRYPGERNSLQVVQNFMDISQRTGGDYCLLRKDPDLCFRKAVDYGSQYYLLSYYAQTAGIVRWRKIRVKVRGTDLQVRARSGYFSAGANGDPEERRKNEIALAVITPVEYRGLPISVHWTTSGEQPASEAAGNAAPAAGPQLSQRRPKQPFVVEIGLDAVTLDTADSNHIQLEVVAVALDLSGRVLADSTQRFDLRPKAPELEQMRSAGLAYSGAVEVPPHSARVRFIVRDDLSERLGTVSVPIAS